VGDRNPGRRRGNQRNAVSCWLGKVKSKEKNIRGLIKITGMAGESTPDKRKVQRGKGSPSFE